MTMQTTRWKPDTCGCTVEYTWDDTVPQETRTHQCKTVTRCPAHAHLDTLTSYDEVGKENKSKNQAIGLLVKEHPDLKPQDIKWQIKEDRSIEIELPASKKAHKDAMNTLAKDKFLKPVTFKDEAV